MIFLKLFISFFKIGLFSFGGGYAMLPLIQSEVERNGWLDNSVLVDFIAVSESTPGPLAVNISTFVGMECAGILGALCATIGVVLPSFIIILIIAKSFAKYQKSRIVNGCMAGLEPAVVGMIGAALISIGMTVIFPNGIDISVFDLPETYVSLVIFAGMAFFAFKKVNPIIIIVTSALLGIVSGLFSEWMN